MTAIIGLDTSYQALDQNLHISMIYFKLQLQLESFILLRLSVLLYCHDFSAGY